MDLIDKNCTLEAECNEMKDSRKSKYREGAYLMIVSGIAAVSAGVIATVISKRRAKQYLSSLGHELEEPPESGTSLALRAFCYSTIITVGIFSFSILGCCKVLGIKNMEDLREKIKKLRKPVPPNPDERTEFESLSDFLSYLSERYKRPEDINSIHREIFRGLSRKASNSNYKIEIWRRHDDMLSIDFNDFNTFDDFHQHFGSRYKIPRQ